jgi:hypothetical protein
MFTLQQRLFMIKTYWRTQSITATQRAYRKEFGVRKGSQRKTISLFVRKLETRGAPAMGTMRALHAGGRPKKGAAAGLCRPFFADNIFAALGWLGRPNALERRPNSRLHAGGNMSWRACETGKRRASSLPRFIDDIKARFDRSHSKSLRRMSREAIYY